MYSKSSFQIPLSLPHSSHLDLISRRTDNLTKKTKLQNNPSISRKTRVFSQTGDDDGRNLYNDENRAHNFNLYAHSKNVFNSGAVYEDNHPLSMVSSS